MRKQVALGRRGLVRRRTIWLFFILVLFYTGLAGRLYYVQSAYKERCEKWGELIRSRDLVIRALRGGIYDRNGRPLAVTIEAASLFANRNECGDRLREAARKAALALGKKPNALEHKLGGTQSIVWLARKLDPRLCEKAVASLGSIRGVGIQRESKRVYPSGTLAAQVVGFTNSSGRGAEGVEHYYENILRGEDGVYRAELDARRRIIPETKRQIKPPRNGSHVYLTIDATIQSIAESALARMAQIYTPRSACAMVMDPHTGEILALANYPSFDPNAPGRKQCLWRNRAVADLYEPGSTLKVVTVAAALNEGFSPRAPIAYCTGRQRINTSTIRCSLHRPFLSGHGSVDMFKLIEHSCNIASAHLALRLGAQKLSGYHEKFGLLSRPQAGFGCEAVAKTLHPDDWSAIRLANIGFGQGLNVTALQMAGVYCTIANGGVRMRPHIVRAIRTSDGTVRQLFKPDRGVRVISRQAAQQLTNMLIACVEKGTGKNAQIPGRSVAGKTGSAQIALRKGGYEKDAFVSSFMGFAPAYSPKIVIAVVVNRPHGSHWGATVAAPVFKEIAEKTLWYLRVPADTPDAQPNKPKQDVDVKRLV